MRGNCTVRFSDHIMANIKNRVTIPVNFKARKLIRSEVAKVLYNRIDSILAKRSIHERTAVNLVEELNLKSSRYTYKSQRKIFLELLKKNLDGVAMSRANHFLRVEILETTNKQDWKCVFRVRKTHSLSIAQKKQLPIQNLESKHREALIDLIDSVVGGKDENYGLYNTFALYYSENLIRRAIGEYKELISL